MGPSGGTGLTLAADIGATKTATALVRRDGTILAKARLATPQTGPRQAADAIVGSLRQLLEMRRLAPAQVAGVGLASAGLCNPRTGVVARSPNLAGWTDVPLGPWVQAGLGLPVLLANDANAAALGELLLAPARAALREHAYTLVAGDCELLMTPLGDDGALLGAASLVFDA
jgi:glucokinase